MFIDKYVGGLYTYIFAMHPYTSLFFSSRYMHVRAEVCSLQQSSRFNLWVKLSIDQLLTIIYTIQCLIWRHCGISEGGAQSNCATL